MKPILVALALFCAPLPLLAQSAKVYTNADLSSGPVTFPAARTPAAAVQILQASHSIVDRTEAGRFAIDPFGPSVTVSPWTSDAIPATPSMFGSSSYANSLWSDPVSAYALQHPIEAAYGYRHSYGATIPRTPRSPSLSRPAVTTPTVTPSAPPIVTHGAGAGRRVR